jgi:formamidase
MADTLIKVDLSKSPVDNELIHNRWHPDIPMACWVKPGDEFILETFDWTGGFIKNNNSADDIRDIDLTTVHYLSGPVGVKGAEPGDLLVVDLLDIGAKEDSLWGFNGFFSTKNGGGFLTEHFPQAQKSIWDFHGMFTSSRHVPGVRYAGLIHPGLIGCLPDPAMLEMWNQREGALIATDPHRVPALGLPPNPSSAHMGQMKGAARDKAAAEGARTVPPREHGGNCDIKDLSRGSKIYFPVYVDGAGLSVGDLHFSQGDGEISFCGAIEMAGWVHMRVSLIKGGVAKYGIKNPIFKPSPITPTYNDYLIFEGISVDEKGKQYYLDVHVAYRQACLNAIEYLKKFGYSGAQAYSILGTAPVQGHISGVVDIPNACATLWLPTQIFDFDINPNASGPTKYLDGSISMPLSPDLV